MRSAREFAEQEGGYGDCLLSMNSAALQGEAIDFSEWGEEAESLARIESETLSAVISLVSDFHSHTISRLQQKSENKPGKPRIEMPENFPEQARLWSEGKLSGVKAARNCGVSYHAFLNRAREFLQEKSVDEDEIWEAWKRGELSSRLTAKRLGCPSREFKSLVKAKGITKDYIPAAFDEVRKLWESGELSKRQAARKLGISDQHFNGCLKMRDGKTSENAQLQLFEKAYQLWHDGIISQRSAFFLSGMKRYPFMQHLKELELEETVSPVSPYLPVPANLPQNFCDAYRSYHLGKISKKEAQSLCGLSAYSFDVYLRLIEEPADVARLEEKFRQVADQVKSGECSLRKASRLLSLPVENIKRLIALTTA